MHLLQEITAYLGITPSGITSVAVEQQLAYDDHANTWHAAPAASLAADLRRDLELARASAPREFKFEFYACRCTFMVADLSRDLELARASAPP